MTCGIQCFELGIFSFNSYVYYLSRGFIVSTRAFNLPTSTFNHATCVFSLLTCGFELVTREVELLTCGFELATCAFELMTCGFELVTRGFELVTRVLLFHNNLVLKTRSFFFCVATSLISLCFLTFSIVLLKTELFISFKKSFSKLIFQLCIHINIQFQPRFLIKFNHSMYSFNTSTQFKVCFNFLIKITYSVLSSVLATSFSTF